MLQPNLVSNDFGLWTVVVVMSSMSVAVVASARPLSGSWILMAVLLAGVASATMWMILSREKVPRALARQLRYSLDSEITLAIGGSQIQRGDNSFEPGPTAQALSVSTQGISTWTRSPSGPRLTRRISWSEVRDIKVERIIRSNIYPALVVELTDSSTFRVNPVRSRGSAWRLGLTNLELQQFVSECASRRPIH